MKLKRYICIVSVLASLLLNGCVHSSESIGEGTEASSTKRSLVPITVGERMVDEVGFPLTISTSIVALLGNPSGWRERDVSVLGYLGVDIHGILLFLSSEHCLSWNEQYSIQVDSTGLENALAEGAEINRCALALVEGTYTPTEYSEPKSNEIVIRQRPGIVTALFVKANL